MLLRAEYIALALQMQEMADGKVDTTERGARNSRSDMSKIQAVHDHACELGANCSMAEVRQPANVSRETVIVSEKATLSPIQILETVPLSADADAA